MYISLIKYYVDQLVKSRNKVLVYYFTICPAVYTGIYPEKLFQRQLHVQNDNSSYIKNQ